MNHGPEERHPFTGRSDRDCEICGWPDRDDIHRINGEPSWFAIPAHDEPNQTTIREPIGGWSAEELRSGRQAQLHYLDRIRALSKEPESARTQTAMNILSAARTSEAKEAL